MSDCNIWQKCRNRDGYGIKRVGNRNVLAHRLSYAQANGLDVFTMGGTVLHSCDNPGCVNPDHLSLGTMADNQKDMADKGRSTIGTRNPQAVLTEDQVMYIRANYKFRCPINGATALGVRFGVSHQTVSSAVRNKTWSHV